MKATILAIVVLAFSVNQASAVSLAVKLACRDDYFAHCSMHAVGSPGVRKCMRAVGRRLSARCIGALAEAGEIKKAKVASKKYYAKKPVRKTHLAKAHAGKRKHAKKYAAEKRYASKYARKAREARRQSIERRRVKRKQYARRYLARS